jgi:HNH endonuclease
MRSLSRLEKPNILIEKETIWTNIFINSNNDRPDNSKYGHSEIRNQLHRISFKKCYYSEVKFAAETEGQVDHYVEISEDKSFAFDWDNLYLAHKDCNQGKPSNLNLPNSNTLNPFLDNDNEIENHLTFEDEFIIAKNNSIKGLNTIKKYRLDKDIFNILRSKELRKFEKLLIEILKNMNLSNRQINESEINALRTFSQPDFPFSLMFRIHLKKHNLLN